MTDRERLQRWLDRAGEMLLLEDGKPFGVGVFPASEPETEPTEEQ